MELNNQLTLATIQCPVCNDHMIHQVFLCTAGHSICQKCIPRLSKCPICVRPLKAGSRNYILEDLVKLLRFPCPHAEYGCKINSGVISAELHGLVCAYRSYTCYVTEERGKCSWTGRAVNLKDHVLTDHAGDSFFYYGMPIMWRSNKFECPVESKLISHKNELFWIHRHQQDGLMCWTLQIIGEQHKCMDYRFNLVIRHREEEKMEAPTPSEFSSFNGHLPLTGGYNRISLLGSVQPDAILPLDVFKNQKCYVCLSEQVFSMYKDSTYTVWSEVHIHNTKEDALKFQGSCLSVRQD